ncbi:hypothetical protein F5146DRAFT_994562 [Armillaria mellea]|nr:hypothetical protein F5146DRAFT_994562 [Armillaria mellea]
MLKLLCFISLAVVSVFASLPAGPCRIMNNNGNVLKLDMSAVVGGANSELVQLWQLIQSVPSMGLNFYMTFDTGIFLSETVVGFNAFLMSCSLGGHTIIENGDNVIVQLGTMENPEFQWIINPTDSTNSSYTSKQEGAKVQAYQSAPGDVNQWWKFV